MAADINLKAFVFVTEIDCILSAAVSNDTLRRGGEEGHSEMENPSCPLAKQTAVTFTIAK